MRARPVISGQPPKLVVSLLSRAGAISALFLFAASIYTCLIIAGHITEKAKIQENALLAGLVEEGWRDSARLQSFLRHLDENGEKKGGQSSSRSQLRDFVFDSFSQMGVEVFRHHFQSVASSFSRPNSSFGSGENVYAIVRAFRAAPVEAILLTVPMRSTHHQSIAVALAFADYARKQLYWARDIVFLFVDGGSRLALESWLSDYHGQEHNFFLPSELAGHGGSFIGAFGLDLSGSLFDNIQLQYGMVNGKLPNMDLLNLFVLLVEKAGSVPSIYGVTRARNEYDFVGAAQTFLRGVVAQSLDELEPLTAPFGRFGLHAVTLRGRPSSAPGSSHSTAVDLVDVVRLVEGGIRSLNNLLEKFHHSYLLYALTHPHCFLSSALYMPLLGLLVAPLLLLGLRHWFSMGGASQLAAVGPALCSLGLGHLLCLAFYAVQTVLYADGRLSSRAHVVPFSLGFPLLVLMAVPLIQPKMSGPSLHFARVAVCLELALFLGALGLVHFSLALLLSALLLPLALASLTIPAHSSRLVRLFCFLLLNPISLCLPLLPLQFCAGKSPILCYQKLAIRMDAIALAHFAHGSWLLALISGPVLAILLGITQILAAEEWKEEEAEKKKKLE